MNTESGPENPADLFSLDGRVALITGGNGGFGRHLASRFAAAGASVVIADIDIEGTADVIAKIEACGRRGLALEVDVTDVESVGAVCSRVVADFGRIDILVNSHGVTERKALVDFTEAEWDRVIGVNLKGTFLCCQAVGRVMLEQKRGAIVNLASIGGLVGMANSVPYCASKGGVVQLTRALGVEWAPHGVRVNALAPTAFDTPMVRNAMAADPDYGQRVLDRVPLGRIGNVEEIVGAALFLASDASSMVTGTVLPVDGGFTAQ